MTTHATPTTTAIIPATGTTSNELLTCNPVHHIIELEDDWEQRLNPFNLIPLNHKTHNTITALYKQSKFDFCSLIGIDDFLCSIVRVNLFRTPLFVNLCFDCSCQFDRSFCNVCFRIVLCEFCDVEISTTASSTPHNLLFCVADLCYCFAHVYSSIS
nr:MAG TPA: HNH endonuclease bacteriophage, HNH Endonuclease, DNA.52A [Caudoviricetes sp.]